ncbi:hypothetical protein SDC9_200829 [bioreactor metagenome]|uniref:Uncharacterized protein n=1 Tax=bioreactor metagenome TaxID=1076179 RepID=A0A645IPA2_9ZZZZ
MAEKDRLRSKKIHVFLSDNEDELLGDKAKYCNLTKSEYVRSMIVNGAIINHSTGDIPAAISEINRVGNNINQIAKKLNETNSFYRKDFDDLKCQYKTLFEYYIERMIGK